MSKLNLLPLQYRTEIHDLVFFFKCFKNMYNLDILDFVSFRTCKKPLRKIDYLTLNVPFSRTESFKNSYFIRVCRSWNELPLNIRESNTLSVFRKKLFAYFYDKFSANFFIVIILFFNMSLEHFLTTIVDKSPWNTYAI